MKRISGLILAALFAGGLPASGFAQEDSEHPPEPSKELPQADAVGVPPPTVGLPTGGIRADLVMFMNLGKGNVAEPVSLSPDLSFGVTDSLTLAVFHSFRAFTGFHGGLGSVCVAGKDKGCDELYPLAGIEARWQVFAQGRVALAPVVGAAMTSADPFTLHLKVGALARAELPLDLFVELRPFFLIPLMERDEDTDTLGFTTLVGWHNRHAELALETAAVIEFEDTADSWLVPMSVVGTVWLTPSVGASLALTAPAVLGGDTIQTGFDNRSVTLSVHWRNRYTEEP